MNLFFIDIETQRTANPEIIARLRAKVKPPGNYKKPESIQQWWAGEGQAALVEAVDRTALDGTWGRLASVAWSSNNIVKCMSGNDEVALLEGIKQEIAAFNALPSDEFYDTGYAAFNGEFDFRFLYQRFIINKIKPPWLPLSKHDYYWDPMREWAGYRGYISQQDLELALGITRDDELTGADIGTAIDAGDWAAVERHNIADVTGLMEIYKRMHA